GLSEGAAADHLGRPAHTLLAPLIEQAGLRQESGRITSDANAGDLGDAEAAVVVLEHQLAQEPFSAPDADQLAELGLGDKQLAAAARAGRLLRLDGGIVLLPSTPARAMQLLARLEQPFTVSAARQALATTRRVAIPLLEHLDSRGWTRRVDSALREIIR